jgi:hypothetical protein
MERPRQDSLINMVFSELGELGGLGGILEWGESRDLDDMLHCPWHGRKQTHGTGGVAQLLGKCTYAIRETGTEPAGEARLFNNGWRALPHCYGVLKSANANPLDGTEYPSCSSCLACNNAWVAQIKLGGHRSVCSGLDSHPNETNEGARPF